jgi:hypothetical protein
VPDALLTQQAADIASMYDAVYGFAETVTATGGNVLAIVDNEYLDADAGGTVTMDTRDPFIRVQDADAFARGATVTVRSVAYTVTTIEPDGGGETIHQLRKV